MTILSAQNNGTYSNMRIPGRSTWRKPVQTAAKVNSWLLALEFHDPDTLQHTLRGTHRALAIGQVIGLGHPEMLQLEWGGLLHDIGKLAVPKHILRKPGKLDEHEWKIIRQHPVSAFEMLMQRNCLHWVVDVPYAHHEKWDGSGYPRGLQRTEIPLLARIFALADVWDALTSHRSYRPAWSTPDAFQFIRSQSGIHFDPEITQIFLQSIVPELPDVLI